MALRVWGYLDEFREERADILDAVTTVLESGQLILGPSVDRFERAFADYHGRRHCVGVDNGTNAIVLALRACGIKPGDEVITVSNTAAPTIVAVNAIGATPVFVDVHEDTYLMDVAQVAGVVTERTRCLLPVHLYGQCVDMAPLQALASEHDLVLVEDCAQSHGARHHGEIAGSMGDAAAFSFYPTKVLGAYGDGGGIVSDRDDVASTARRLRYYGMEERYFVVETPAYNSRLDELHAEILYRKLGRLGGYIERRRSIAQAYQEGLGDTSLVLPAVAEGNDHVYYVYVVRHHCRDQIIERMREHDIHLNISYPWPVHTMTGFRHLGYEVGALPVTEQAAHEIFSLPMYPTLGKDEQDKVISCLRDVLAGL